MKLIVLSFMFLIISFFFSMLGMGGGMLYVPFLLLAKIPIHNAATISLGLIFIMATSALWVFIKNNLVDWKLAAIIDPPTNVMAFLGGYFAGYISEILLKILLAVVLIISGVFMIYKRNPKAAYFVNKKWWCWQRNFKGRCYRVNLFLTIPITAAIGALSGMIGITGGVIKLPLMVLFCGVPMDIAIATSTAMVSFTALFGFSGRIMAGHLNLTVFIVLAVVVFIGGQLGSRMTLNLDKTKFKKIFGVILILLALKIIVELFINF